jgi:hypothetical protein
MEFLERRGMGMNNGTGVCLGRPSPPVCQHAGGWPSAPAAAVLQKKLSMILY